MPPKYTEEERLKADVRKYRKELRKLIEELEELKMENLELIADLAMLKAQKRILEIKLGEPE